MSKLVNSEQLRRAMTALQREFILTDDEARKMALLVAASYGILDPEGKK